MSPCSSDCIFGMHLSRLAYSLWGFWIATNHLQPLVLPVAAVTVHRDCRLQQLAESVRGAVISRRHRLHDPRELLEVELLGRQKRTAFEERDHSFKQISSSPHDEDERPVVQAIPLYVAASAEAIPYQR